MEYSLFFKYWEKTYNELIDINQDNQRELNNIWKTNKTIRLVKSVIILVKNNNMNLWQAIKQLNLTSQKTRIYKYIDLIKNIKDRSEIIDLVVKNTGPKEIKYVYDLHIRKLMCDAYYNYHFNKVNIWIKFKKIYKRLSSATVNKIIKQDARNKNNKPRINRKHPSRFYNLPFGNIQMDLKIIGPKESPTGKRITIFDAKDEQSKLYYMEVVSDGSQQNLLQATKNMICYFNSLGMKIKRIRTDNAMVFKQNNFVRSFAYDELLRTENIINEKIPPRQPQCNGVIERQHLIIDKEFKPLISKNDTIKSLNKKAKMFMKNFNFYRYHSYNFLSKFLYYKKWENRWFIPFEFFKMNGKHPQKPSF